MRTSQKMASASALGSTRGVFCANSDASTGRQSAAGSVSATRNDAAIKREIVFMGPYSDKETMLAEIDIPWANPGTDSQFPANCAGNLVSVPGLGLRFEEHLAADGVPIGAGVGGGDVGYGDAAIGEAGDGRALHGEGQLQALQFAHEPGLHLGIAEQMTHVDGTGERLDAKVEALIDAAGFDDFAIHGREDADVGFALVEAERGTGDLHARSDLGQVDRVGGAEEAGAEVVEADGDRAVGFGTGPGVAAVVHAVEGERHAEDLGFCLGGMHRRMPRDEFGVGLTLAAIEGMLAFAAFELAGQDVPAGAVGGGQIVKVRAPADVFHLALAQVAVGTPEGVEEGGRDHQQHGVESAHEDVAGDAKMKTVVPRKHKLESPDRKSVV